MDLFDVGRKKKRRTSVEDLIGSPSTRDGREWVKPHQWKQLGARIGQPVLVAWFDSWREGELLEVTIDEFGPDSIAIVKMFFGEIPVEVLDSLRIEKGKDPRKVCPECNGKKSITSKMCAKCWAKHPDNSWAR